MKKGIKNILNDSLIFASLLSVIYIILIVGKYLVVEEYSHAGLDNHPPFEAFLFEFSFTTSIISVVFSAFFLKMISMFRETKESLKKQNTSLQTIQKERLTTQTRFEKFASMLPEGLYETDIQGHITFATNNLIQMMGFKNLDQIMGMDVFSIMVDSENIEKAKIAFSERLSNRRMTANEYNVITATGEKKTIVLQASALLNDLGEVIGTRGVVLDSSEIVKLREDYKTNFELLDNIIETMPLPLYLQNMRGEYKNFNQAFVNFLGKKHEDEVRFKTVFDVFPHDISRTLYKKSTELMRSNHSQQQFQIKFDGVDGLVTQTKFINEKEKMEGGIIGIIQDLSIINNIKSELASSEETFKVLTDNSIIGIAIITDHKLSYTNSKLTDIIGYKNNEIVLNESFWSNLIHERDINKFNKIIKVIQKQDHVKGHFKIRSQAGLIKYVEIELRKVDYEEGQSILVTVVDITPYIHALKKSDAKLESVD